MTLRTKVIVTSFAFALPAFVVGHLLWMPVGAMPGPDLLPLFIVESFIEALSFGIGMSFLLYSWPAMKNLPLHSPNLKYWLYLSVGWLLVSWWPHGNLHTSNGENFPRLLGIEYGFHVTLVIAASIVAYSLITIAGRTAKKP